MTQSIQQIKVQLFQTRNIDEEFLKSLRQDNRKGIQTLLKQYDTHQQKKVELEELHEQMIEHESLLWQDGYHSIVGIDEVGRGPLAGPVVAAAVVLPRAFKLLGLTDSKKLSKQKREQFAEVIKEQAIAYSVQMIEPAIIDQINIYQATKQAMTNAVNLLKVKPDYLLVDAMTLPIDIQQLSLVKGDQRSISIAASSILAKVARDQYMDKVDQTYPGYGFSSHVGYGTKEHIEAINRLGLTPEHRRSFRPIKK